MKLILERRPNVSKRHMIMVPVLSALVGIVIGGIFLSLTGYNAIKVFTVMANTSYTTLYGITDTLASATPLILAGLAAAFAFRVNLYTIGAEGQLYAGAITGSAAGILFGASTPLVAIPAVIIAGAFGGMLWMFLPALFKVKYGTNEIITTLMFNFVALYLMRYLIYGAGTWWRDPESTNFPIGKEIGENAYLPRIGKWSVHWGFLVALLIALAVWFVLTRTRFGYNMRVLGDAPNAARYAGISVNRTTILVLLGSGALAGLAGGVEVAGRAHALDPNGLSIGIGYAGIIVAALARLNPWGVVFLAIAFGGLQNSAAALQTLGSDRVPIAIATILQGMILLLALAGEILVRNRIRFRKDEVTA